MRSRCLGQQLLKYFLFLSFTGLLQQQAAAGHSSAVITGLLLCAADWPPY
jgi:hypothetical protein